MKKLIYILLLIVFGSHAQTNPAPFYSNIALPNAAQVTTAERVPVIDTDLEIASWISSANLLDGLISGSGTINYLAKFTTAEGGSVGDSKVYDNGTNVGIGTTNPLANLTINGQASEIKTGFKGALLLSGSNPNANYDLANKIVISSSTGYTPGLYTGGIHITRRHPHQTYSHYGAGIRAIGDSSTIHGSSLELYTSILDNPNVTGIKITEDGKIGIGIDDPTAKTEVLTTNPLLDYLRVSSSDATRGDVFTVKASTGRVGIGEVAPSEMLEVNGNVKANNLKSVDSFTPIIEYIDGTALTYTTLVTSNYSIASDVVTFNIEISGVTTNHIANGIRVTGLPAPPLNATTIVDCWMDLTGGVTSDPQCFLFSSGNKIESAAASTNNLTRFIISGSYIKQ